MNIQYRDMNDPCFNPISKYLKDALNLATKKKVH